MRIHKLGFMGVRSADFMHENKKRTCEPEQTGYIPLTQ